MKLEVSPVVQLQHTMLHLMSTATVKPLTAFNSNDLSQAHAQWTATHRNANMPSSITFYSTLAIIHSILKHVQMQMPQMCAYKHARSTLPHCFCRVSNRSAGMISRFPVDFFTKIQNLQFCRHLLGRVTNSWDHTDPVYPSNSSVKGHLPGIDSPNIN